MKALPIIAALTAVGVTSASAEEVLLLAGQYQCVQNCRGTGWAYIAQSARELRLVDEAGQPSRGWIDEPGHLWAKLWNKGAVYSPDGFIIFDDGTAWQRIVPEPPPPLPPAPLPYIAATADRGAASVRANKLQHVSCQGPLPCASLALSRDIV